MHATRLRLAYRVSLALLWVALLAISLPLTAYAQNGTGTPADPARSHPSPGQDLRFEHLTIGHGLSNPNVWGVVQDNHGFIWIGTEDGLNRYDGNTFKIYRHDPNDSNSLGDSSVRSLATDRAGNIWIGSWGGGLSMFDPSTEVFTRYGHDPSDPRSLSGNQVIDIYEDQAGVLWVATSIGLSRLDRDTDTFINYRADPDDPDGLGEANVQAVYGDQTGDLWVGTNGGGLHRLAPDTGKFTHYRHDPADPNSLSSDQVASVYQDPTGIVWVGNFDGGLNRFDPDSGMSTRYQHDPNDPNSLGRGMVRVIHQDREGVLWVGTLGGGLFQFDRGTQQFVRHQHNANDPSSLSYDGISDIYEEAGGTIWIATNGGGVNRWDPTRKPFSVYRHNSTDPGSLTNNDVRSLYVDHTDTLWVGTVLGLNRYNPLAEPGSTSEQFARYLHDRTDPQGLNGVYVITMIEDQEGALWLGSLANGLIRYDRDNASRIDIEAGRFTQYQHDPSDPRSLPPGILRDLYVDASGTLWVGTTGGGLAWFDSETEEFHRYQHDPSNTESLSANSVTSILEDHAGELWIATLDGLNRFDRETEESVRYPHDPNDPSSLSHNGIVELFKDSEGVLWIGTMGGGLNRLNSQDETFTHYTRSDGLPSDIVLGITEDDQGFLWLSTSEGLCKFDPRLGTFRNYDVSDGLQSNKFHISSVARNSSGELFFGGAAGFNAFHPGDIKDNSAIPPVVITDFQLANRPVEVGGDSVLQESINETKELMLSYDDRVISFEFAALNYSSPEKNRYRYKLEGFDEEWTGVGSDRRFVTYTNLDPGKYVFRVLGSNNDGVWNEEGAAIRLTITPPWWATWYFRGAVLLLLVGLLVGGYGWRVRSIQARSRELEEQVAERTAELEALLDLSGSVVSTLELDPLLDLILDGLRNVVDYDGAIIRRLSGDKMELLAYRLTYEDVTEPARYLPVTGIPVLDEMVEHGRVFYIGDIEGSPGVADRLAAEGDARMEMLLSQTHSWLGVPLIAKDDVIGMLSVIHSRPHHFSQETVSLAQAFANQAAIAIENAQLYENAQETATLEERTRLARELHDSVTQTLFSANVIAEATPRIWQQHPEIAQRNLEKLRRLTRGALAEMRTLLLELRPTALRDQKLDELLETLAEAAQSRSRAPVVVQVEGDCVIPDDVTIAFYRIAQEALNNVAKHANATQVYVSLVCEQCKVVLRIRDDGRGFDPEVIPSGHLGIGIMEERAKELGADFSIESEPGSGTEILVAWADSNKRDGYD